MKRIRDIFAARMDLSYRRTCTERLVTHETEIENEQVSKISLEEKDGISEIETL